MMPRAALLGASLLVPTGALACTTCDRQLQQRIYDSTFFPNLLTMLSAFMVLAALVVGLTYLYAQQHRTFRSARPGQEVPDPVPLTTAAMVLGIGLGGFIDGIVLHQILQWHQMLSNQLPPTTLLNKSVNMFWDGIFHAFTLLVVGVGVVLLWKLLGQPGVDRSGRLLAGGFLLGWGLFNIVEGIIDHHLLKLHNVREITAAPDLWNYGFLALSVGMILGGALLVRNRPATG
jgi:uncharacterized membrane protein